MFQSSKSGPTIIISPPIKLASADVEFINGWSGHYFENQSAWWGFPLLIQKKFSWENLNRDFKFELYSLLNGC